MQNKKRQRRPAILFALALAFLSGCASSPNLKPTVELCRKEFQRRIAQVRSGKLGYQLADEEQRRRANLGLLEALEAHEKACALALEGGK